MRNSLMLVTGSLLLLTAAYADKPAKRTVDFGQKMLSGTTNALGNTGVVVKIQSASIASDGTITARATIVDRDGNPLDRLGIATPGPVSLSFVAAYIPAGQSQYVAYTTTVLAATINNNPSQTQAANDSGGTFTNNAIGDYTYTFKTKATSGFDTKATHSIGVSAARNLAEFGTFDEWSEVGNDVYSFVPSGGAAVSNPRGVVDTTACNNCHNPMFGHGGSRIEVQLCIMCHTPQTVNPDTKLTMDFKVMVHKLHMGSSLPSVIAGTPYRVWHRGAWSDFSTVVFPQDVRNCTTCHSTAAPQADNWKTNPTAETCTSCHDNVNLATGVNHPAGPQADNKQCSNCHTSKMVSDFDASIPGAHLIPANSASLPGIVSQVLKVDNATPGNAPIVTFSVNDKSGNPLDFTKLTSFRIVISGDNSDYGVSLARVSETPTAANTTGSNGTYTYQMTTKLPATAAGSYTVSIEATNNVTLLAGTTLSRTVADNASPTEFYFSVDSSAVQARRQVVSLAKCSACHVDLTFVHNGARSNTQECVICHNPTLIDGTLKQSVNFAWQIHSIHRGESLANPYMLGTTNYQDLRFPGDLRDCTTCHLAGTYLPENVGAKAMVQSPGGFTPTTPPISAACQACHDDVATASHTLSNGNAIGESCTVCHGAGAEFSVDRVHQRIF